MPLKFKQILNVNSCTDNVFWRLKHVYDISHLLIFQTIKHIKMIYRFEISIV